MNPKFFVAFILVIALLSGCGLFESEQKLPDFGYEEGYFYWNKEEKITIKRDRNYLSIRFYEEYGETFHDSVLKAYNIDIIW
jgi:hypothetical protein